MNVVVCVKQIPDPAVPGELTSDHRLKRDGNRVGDAITQRSQWRRKVVVDVQNGATCKFGGAAMRNIVGRDHRMHLHRPTPIALRDDERAQDPLVDVSIQRLWHHRAAGIIPAQKVGQFAILIPLGLRPAIGPPRLFCPIIFIISDICRCCFKRRLTSSTETPAPAAMRFLREALRRSGFLRSPGVIELMMATCCLTTLPSRCAAEI